MSEIAAPKKNKINRVCLITLTILAILYTAHFAQDLILLLLVAGLVSLLLSPGVKALNKLHIPRVMGATILLSCLVVPTSVLIVQLEKPVTKWAKLLPELSAHVTEQIEALNEAMEKTSTTLKPAVKDEETEKSWFSWFDSEPEPEAVASSSQPDVIKTQLKESLFSFVADFMSSAPFVLIQLLTTLILILFALVYSPQLYQHYVELFVQDTKQKKAYQLALSAQQQLSRYILTVSAINIGLSVSAMSYFSVIGLEDALLLGIIVGVVNFIPFVGPAFALALIAIAGLVQWGFQINVVIAVGGVLALNVIESQLLTPLVLAKNMRINPFIIILWLLITGWLWGLVGILIAVPLLVCIKLILSESTKTQSWVKLLST